MNSKAFRKALLGTTTYPSTWWKINLEPIVITQCRLVLPHDERHAWFRRQAREATKVGATFHRFSIHPTIPDLILYEGWYEQPRDQGKQRWIKQDEPAN